MTTFSGRIPTACGTATSEVGPFYSSGDASVYLDLGFFDELQALADALHAAAAVGDDRIQKKMQGQVIPETWTHGSAANRRKWLTTGSTKGDPAACDTFGSGAVS